MKQITKDFMALNRFKSPTSVQSDVLEQINKKNDLIVMAPTGTGKTHSFLFAILETVDPTIISNQAIILAPTRELAMQIYDFTAMIKEVEPNMTVELAIGGMDNSRLKTRLEEQPHILITTPGKFQDVLSWSVLRVDTVKLLIIDEMDMMFDYGFIEEIDSIASRFLDNTRFMLFSATLPQGLNQFIKKYLRNPVQIQSQEERFQPKIEHILIHRRHKSLEASVLDVLLAINPSLVIVFANTKEAVSKIALYLREFGIDNVEIHGDVDDRARMQVVKRIRTGKVRYIIATDLAARGIDLPEVSHVVNANIPTYDLSFYTHRAGRTGRTGRDGYCISLVDDSDQNAITRLMAQNVTFKFMRINKDTLADSRPFFNFERRKRPLDPEVVAKLKRKNVKVKPGYKRKHKQKIEKLMQQRRREVIKTDIKRQKKERAKDRQAKMKED
ncbi:MAG: DEAD/DEAH box helicase [Erysipelothrix sp.]|nr:DEAD/DEAH box helicase [Erysipelothrix sp.]